MELILIGLIKTIIVLIFYYYFFINKGILKIIELSDNERFEMTKNNHLIKYNE